MPPFEGRCPKGGGLLLIIHYSLFILHYSLNGGNPPVSPPSKGGLVRCIIGGAARAADCRPYIF